MNVAAADTYPAQMTRVTLAWVAVGLVLFPILAILGLVMRTLQAGYFAATPPEWFYAVMTLHGLGMVGVWFVAGLAAMSFLLTSYVRPNLTVSWIALGMTAVGVVLLVAATLVGKLVARAIERGRGRPRCAARRGPLREPRGPGHHRPHGRRRDAPLGVVAGRAAGAHDGLHALWRHLFTLSARAPACRRVTRPAR